MLNSFKKERAWSAIHLGAVLLLLISMPYKSNINSVFLALVVLIFLFRTPLKLHLSLCLKNKRIVALALFFFLHVLSILNSSNIAAATKEVVLKLPFLLLPISLAAVCWTSTRQKIILNIFIFNIFILSLISFFKTYYYIFQEDLFNFKDVIAYDWAYFAFILPEAVNVHAPYFSIYIAVALIFIFQKVHLHYKDYSWLQKIGWLFLFVYFVFFLALLSSRTAIFATLFTLGTWAALILIRKGYTGYLVGLGGILILTCFAFYTYVPYLKKKLENQSGISIRSNIWQAGNIIIKENIMFGVGTGDVKEHLRVTYRKIGFQEGLEHMYNAHNQYLQTTMVLGISGFIMLLIVFYTLIAEAVITKNIAALAFYIIFVLCCITESLFNRQHGVILFCFFSSLLPYFAVPLKPSKNKDVL